MDTTFTCTSMNLKDLGVDVFAAKPGKYLKLAYLVISFNAIEVLHEDQFMDLIKLQYIMLNDNKIVAIGLDLFRNNIKLKYIYLDNNNIEHFDFNLNKLPKLASLVLSNNNLSTLKEGAFKHFLVKDNDREDSSSRTLHLKNNLFTCDCSMAWMRAIKVDINVHFQMNHTCTSDISAHISLSCFLINIRRSDTLKPSCLNTNVNVCMKTKINSSS